MLEKHDSVGALHLLRPRELMVVAADRTAHISDGHLNRFFPWRAAPDFLRSAGNLPICIEEMDAVLYEDASAILCIPHPVIGRQDLCEVLDRERPQRSKERRSRQPSNELERGMMAENVVHA